MYQVLTAYWLPSTTGVWSCWPALSAGSPARWPSACFIVQGPSQWPNARYLDLARRGGRRLAESGPPISSRCWLTIPAPAAGYNIPVTLLSLVFAVAIVAVGLCVALSSARARRCTSRLGGAIIGAGVAAMHYTGMLGAGSSGATSCGRPVSCRPRSFSEACLRALAMLVATRRDDSAHTAGRHRPADGCHRLASFHGHGRGHADSRIRRSAPTR